MNILRYWKISAIVLAAVLILAGAYFMGQIHYEDKATTIREINDNPETHENRTLLIRNVTIQELLSNRHIDITDDDYKICDYQPCLNLLTDGTGSICRIATPRKIVSCSKDELDMHPNASCAKIVYPDDDISIMRGKIYTIKAVLKNGYDEKCDRMYWYLEVMEKNGCQRTTQNQS